MSMVEKSTKLPDRSSAPRIDRREERGGVVIRLEGPINEHFDRVKFVSSSTNRIVIIDLDAVGWITSFGIREWVSAIKEIPKSYLAFINVRPAVVQQFNMLTSFAGDGELVSFYAPFSCPRCNHYQERLIDLLELHPLVKRWQLPPVTCDACRHDSELDDVAESYLAYAAQARPPSPPPEYHEVLRGAPGGPTPGQRFTVEKLVEGHITVLLVSGELGGRASFKRAAAGLEGTVALSLSGVQTYDREGLARLRPLWQDAGPGVLLVEAPLPLVQALPDDAWRRFAVLSLRAEMQCAQGHVLKDALLQNDELWRLVRGIDPLKCPSCGEPLAAAGVADLAARKVIATPDADTERAVAGMIERRHRARATAFAAEPFGLYTLVEMLGVGGMAEVYLARRGGPADAAPPVVL
ncbi:MAG TPA: hypothetical protein VN253_08555, partial [Kofleriaceae bacterium]|nr:hypothetical protein [Kofleriaceae bacterium]